MERLPSSELIRSRARVLIGLLAPLVLCGCQCVQDHSFTYNVWHGGTFFRPHSPAPNPQLAVAEVPAQRDFVISYDEQAERTGVITHRSYLVRPNIDAWERGRKPAFLTKPVTNAVPVPVNPAQPVVPYVTATNETFTIHAAAENLGPQRLPTYAETSGAAAKVLLTPLAVVGDVTILSFILAIQAATNPNNWIR